MRLTHIKLAGFKSFVDATTIPVPGQLVAVVGPNGCGKSNVIDAVRWVLGESSAKQLRGESMTDVIFNGATTRKPVSRASVELIFDNTEGRAAGQWRQYAEISIKRVLTRQGDSSYYINNLQCRRRDIADLFMGTGVGKGGYAIIEQGMISRIIEARPEELRGFLEEAAGVSKYKERRKETEHRLADTKDNLLRVDDIVQELDRQLDKLEQQAEIAGQYQVLKEKVIERQNVLALLRKQEAQQEAAGVQVALAETQTQLEQYIAQIRQIEVQLEIQRETHYSASDSVQLEQTHLAEANARVVRLEQQLLHLRENRQRLTTQSQTLKAQFQQFQQQQNQLQYERQEAIAEQEEARMRNEETLLHLEDEQLGLPPLETKKTDLDHLWQEAQFALSQSRQSSQLANQQLQHIQKNLDQLKQRQIRLQHDLSHADQKDMVLLQEVRECLLTLDEEIALLQCEREQADAIHNETEMQLVQLQRDLDTARSEHTELLAKQKVLSALQQQSESAAEYLDWQKRHGLANQHRLFELLSITPGWERAVESVLGQWVDAITTETLPGDAPPSAATLLLTPELSELLDEAPASGSLAAQVHSTDLAIKRWVHAKLKNYRCSDALPTVLNEAEDTAYVTPEGHIATQGGRKFFGPDGALNGVLERQAEIETLARKLEKIVPVLDTLSATVTAQHEQKHKVLQTQRAIRERLEDFQRQRAGKQVELARMLQQHESSEKQRLTLEAELREIAQQISEETEALLLSEEERLIAEEAQPEAEEKLERIKLERLEAETALELQRNRVRQAEREVQQSRFAEQTANTRSQELGRRIQELSERVADCEMQLEETLAELELIDESDFDIGFQEAVNLRLACEQKVADAKDRFNDAGNQLRELEAEKSKVEQILEPTRDKLGELRLKEQEARLAAERFTQELQEAEADESALLPLLVPGMKASSLVSEIGRLTQAINGLGPVNLAALEELTTARERKTYLDSQAADLRLAMATLEEAIQRIDQETRALLQSTYDEVNASLQALFPALFGGGHAELLLTGEEILDAGIQIMAQPPGKKNSTIHLLSGGEKALTALSLVFSLFQLNPAPFCLLDEVDAPLDDANTGRFCDLVKKMAERTQFLYISHNKITMEMASQLVGVTMQEKGVSRIVAVDIEQAIKMADPQPA